MRNRRVGYTLIAAALLSSCGTPGVPLPPSLELPKPVTDLRAVRKGNKVVLNWTAPILTTDRHNIRRLGETEICRNIGAATKQCGSPVAKVPPAKTSGHSPQAKPEVTFTDELSPSVETSNSGSTFFYSVSVQNPYGRSAGLSNQVPVPAAPTLPPPNDFRAELTPEGVRLSWAPIPAPTLSGLRFSYRVYRRRQGSAKDEIAGEVPVASDSQASLVDSTLEWENTYSYRATVLTFATNRSVEGDDTPSITVVAHDVFPPAAPMSLQAVFSGPGQKVFIDLIWHPNLESDIAGYNVYRHGPGAAAVRVNSDMVKAPAFRDENVSSGHQYWYSITAVDLRGNESPHSEEASEKVP